MNQLTSKDTKIVSSPWKQKYGEWAIVTGASDGIGKDFVYELAKHGFSLILVARRKSILEDIQRDLKERFNSNVEVYSLDLSSEDDTNKLINSLEGKNVGLAVVAAGFGSIGEFSKLPLESELNMVDLNCRSVVQFSHRILSIFSGRKKSGLILFGSLVGFQGSPFSATYSATKSFIQSFAEALHHEVKSKGIDVLSVAPGPVETGFGNRAGMNMGQAQSPEGIAKVSMSALGNQTTVRPGFLSKFLGYSLITLPRGIRVVLMKQIMSGMVK